MSYIDGFLVAVPTANKDGYREMATKAAAIFREFGALQVVETWGDDVSHGKVTDFYMATKAEEGEAIVFSWIVWPDKATRDAGWAKCMEDERMKPPSPMPFDGKRMIWGGFRPLVQSGDEK